MFEYSVKALFCSSAIGLIFPINIWTNGNKYVSIDG